MFGSLSGFGYNFLDIYWFHKGVRAIGTCFSFVATVHPFSNVSQEVKWIRIDYFAIRVVISSPQSTRTQGISRNPQSL